MVSGEWVVAPSTPKPPARLTAATTSRQWLNASSGNSIHSISQIGDFMVVLTPCAGLGADRLALNASLAVTLAQDGWLCQAWQPIRPHPEERPQAASRRMAACCSW